MCWKTMIFIFEHDLLQSSLQSIQTYTELSVILIQ